jgi:hypothetical protein
MPLPLPTFDTRTYRDLLTEALRRVPVHNPEWNNLSDSDPGVTLLQLFAFLGESIIYRANLIPERNRQKFLRLLGQGLQPAQPGRGLVAFALRREDTQPVEVRTDDEVYAGKVPFRPEYGLLALPGECRAYYKEPVEEPERSRIEATYNRLYASVRSALQGLEFYRTRPLDPPSAGALLPALDLAQTVDRSVWLALLAASRDTEVVRRTREALASRVLTLGVAPALDATGKALYPAGPPAADGRPRLVFEVPDATSPTPRYVPLPAAFKDDVLDTPGVVELRLPAADALRTWDNLGPLESGVGGFPPALDNAEDGQRLITWIRVRAPRLEDDDAGQGGKARVALSWIGMNAATVAQRTHVAGERLSDGTGEPDQSAQLANTPVIPDNLQLTVNGEAWARVDDLSQAGPEVPPSAPLNAAAQLSASLPPSKVFTVDRESGEIRFGDGARGMRPPRGALVLCNYDFGGGPQGQVGIGAISRSPARLPSVAVTNPIPTWGAAAGETVADAEKRIPGWLRHRNVLATQQDYREIARATPGVAIGRVEVLALTHPDLPGQVSEGVVTVLVIPATDSREPDAPTPDRLFLQTVCAHLEPRRILTTELHIRGPDYQPIAVGVGIRAVPGEPEGPLAERVRAALLRFLSPLAGGFEQTGWPLRKAVEAAELQAAAARERGVAQVSGLVLARADGTELPNGLSIAGLQLPKVTAVVVTIGAPPTLGEIFGEAPPATEPAALPVPVAPEEC